MQRTMIVGTCQFAPMPVLRIFNLQRFRGDLFDLLVGSGRHPAGE